MQQDEEQNPALRSCNQPLDAPKHRKKENSQKTQTQTHKSPHSESDDDIFQPEYHTMKKLRLPIRRKLSKGAWTLAQNKIFVDFLETHLDSFNSEAQRRIDRVFCQMSETLNRKRTPDQCRSHHQKLLGSCRTVRAVVAHLRGKIKESQEAFPLRRRTRVIGKLLFRKWQASEQVERVEQLAFGCLKTFKNSGRVVLEMREADIECYNLE